MTTDTTTRFAEHKANAVRKGRAEAVRLCRPMYVFAWQGRWAMSAKPHRNIHDEGFGYVICHPTGVATEIAAVR